MVSVRHKIGDQTLWQVSQTHALLPDGGQESFPHWRKIVTLRRESAGRHKDDEKESEDGYY